MGSKMASNGPHSAGIFADMTVDGPEIGTLVIIVDRAKNLPNRKTMGKQNPYAAARLGKEARKTETDRRGGQTPRWDQELRFTVHDSPDYYTLKVSVFSEDKRTDLVGEAWIDLIEVVKPGGGKSDLWQQLSCKGKYAGEIRIELTYYDTRENPEKAENITSVAEELQQTYGGLNTKVKRRPLPVNPNFSNEVQVVIPERPLPGRAKHGPRDFQTPPRATSMPPEAPKTYNYPHSQTTLFGQTLKGHQASASVGTTPVYPDAAPPDEYYGEYDPNLGPQVYDDQTAQMQPDFLPELGPSPRHRGSLPPQARYAQRQPPAQHSPQQQPGLHAPAALHHSHSAPTVPSALDEAQEYDDGYRLRTDYPEPNPDVDYQYQQVREMRNDVSSGWDPEYRDPYGNAHAYANEEPQGPPLPPVHSNSSPAVPQYSSPHNHPYPPPASRYGQSPTAPRQQYVPNSSPLQSIERNYAPQQTPQTHRHPARGRSFDEYGEPPYQYSYNSTPNLTPPNHTPPSHGSAPSYGRQYQHQARHSFADPYSTPSRPHPLSQQVPRARSPIPNPYANEPPRSRSPNPYARDLPPRARSPNPYQHELPGSSPYQQDYRERSAAPIIKPRAISPQPALRQPSSAPTSSKPLRNPYSIQFPVRAFESSDGNPLSTSRAVAQAPGQLKPARKSVSPRPSVSADIRPTIPFSPDSFDVHNPNTQDKNPPSRGPIVGWHGQEIDPSDHLPVDSWAPEPSKKAESKTYGLGRDRDFGPRSAVTNSAGRVSRDTVVNVRMKPQAPIEPEPQPQTSKIRARLVQKPAPGSSPMEPLRDHQNFNAVPNPYEQQQHYSRGFTDGSPGIGNARGGRLDTAEYGPPSVPPKVPLSQQQQSQDYGTDALSREISSIDLGSSRRPALPTFTPVRSHRDRHSYW